ncbi:MAG TPA: hypothetical protein VKN82_07230 [Desulfohalobiaceae bacterium]|nr:hypothetical protein [Desulfohalobiaceae bacterium]
MKKVLLAIDGLYPGKDIFTYSVQFCQRMSTELVILQIVNPKCYKDIFRSLQRKISSFQKFFEQTMETATLAEAGGVDFARTCLEEGQRQLNNVMPISREAGIDAQVLQCLGRPDKEIYNYVKNNRDIILTVYDSNGFQNRGNFEQKKNLLKRKVSYNLGIPLVVLQPGQEGKV